MIRKKNAKKKDHLDRWMLILLMSGLPDDVI
jgi:hypothetical protein